MKHFKIKSDIWFLVFVAVYLFGRQWPYGGALETMADIAVSVALVVTVVSMVRRRK